MKYSADPTAARKEPMTKVKLMMLLDLDAHQLRGLKNPGEAARMAMPILVWLMSWVSTTTSATTREWRNHRHHFGGRWPAMVSLTGQAGQAGVHLRQSAGDIGGQDSAADS